jgi:hypothetical protein
MGSRRPMKAYVSRSHRLNSSRGVVVTIPRSIGCHRVEGAERKAHANVVERCEDGGASGLYCSRHGPLFQRHRNKGVITAGRARPRRPAELVPSLWLVVFRAGFLCLGRCVPDLAWVDRAAAAAAPRPGKCHAADSRRQLGRLLAATFVTVPTIVLRPCHPVPDDCSGPQNHQCDARPREASSSEVFRS